MAPQPLSATRHPTHFLCFFFMKLHIFLYKSVIFSVKISKKKRRKNNEKTPKHGKGVTQLKKHQIWYFLGCVTPLPVFG
jgi:hypothetical protein